MEEKSNEIKAIPELLDKIQVKGQVVTIDAMGTQTTIAEKIRKKHAEYVLALKGNQGHFSCSKPPLDRKAAPQHSSKLQLGFKRIGANSELLNEVYYVE